MKSNILGLMILFAAILTSYHFYYAHVTKGVYPLELILSIVIMSIVGFGVFAKLITLKNS